MGSSNGNSKDSNYMNMQDYKIQPYVMDNVSLACGIPMSELKTVTSSQALRYGGGIPSSCIEIKFKDMPTLCITDAAIDIHHSGKIYKATPDLKQVTSSKATNKINSAGGSVTLSAIDETFIDLVQANKTQKARVEFKVAMVDTDNNCLAMFTEHRGFITIPTVTFDNKSNCYDIKFKTTNFFEMLDEIPGTRSADSIQQSIWPGDKGLQEVTVEETEEWSVDS